MTKRIRMTAREIEAVLSVAGNAEAWDTFIDGGDEAEAASMVEAYERGMDKLRAMLARKSRSEGLSL